MKRSVVALFAVLLLLCAETAQAADTWIPLTPRRDFEVKNPEELFKKACKALEADSNLHFENLEKNAYYVNAIRSAEYKVDVVVLLIEDRTAQSPNVYGFVFFELPKEEIVSTGSALIDIPLDEWLKWQLYETYDEEFSGSI